MYQGLVGSFSFFDHGATHKLVVELADRRRLDLFEDFGDAETVPFHFRRFAAGVLYGSRLTDAAQGRAAFMRPTFLFSAG